MTQRANPKTGCLTAVVRRLLCSGSQQTHPSDNILDSDETLQLLSTYEEMEETKKETKSESPTQNDEVSLDTLPPPPPPPNVVAKLMGLDNPAPGSNRFRYFDDSGSAVARSKSVNFMDYILRVNEEEEEEEEDGHRQCRRVRASVSFREIVPTSARPSSNQQQKKHDFLLMYLDKLDEKRELVSSSSRSKRFEKVLEDSKKPPLPPPVKKKENEKVAKKFKDEPRKAAKKKKKSENRSDVNGAKKVRWFLSPSKSKSSEKMALLGVGEGESKNIPVDEFRGKETESPESKSNASPVSVLDRDLYDYLILDDDYYFSGDSESASELATKQVETSAKSSCSSSPSRTITKKENNSNTTGDSEETEFITKLMNMLSDLSEEDMQSSTWVSTSSTKPVDYTQVEDFCVEFGQEILDLVMDQLVDELLYLV